MACPLGCREERGEVGRVERRGVETHRTCCSMRTVKCEYCSVSVNACLITVKEIDHLKRFQSLIPMISSLGATGNLEWEISGVSNKILQNKDTFSDPFYVGLYMFRGQVQW